MKHIYKKMDVGLEGTLSVDITQIFEVNGAEKTEGEGWSSGG